MKCKSCQGDVPPKFAHAIAVNMCPLCGSEIMEPELQETLVNLKTAMEATSQYSEEIFDWLNSNYNLIQQSVMDQKIKELEISFKDEASNMMATMKAQSIPKTGRSLDISEELMADKDGNQISGEAIQDPSITNKFMINAGVNKMVERNDHYKKIVSEIKKNGAPALMDESGRAGVVTPDMLQSLDSEDAEEFQNILDKEYGVASGLDNDYDDGDEIPSVVMNMANQVKSSKAGYSAKDMAALERLQSNAKKASRAMGSGGSVGLIKR